MLEENWLLQAEVKVMDAARNYQEQRSTPRYRVVRRMQVSNLETGEKLGNVINLSSQGFMLLSKAPLSSDQRLLLLLELPEEVAGQRQIRLEVRCLWCAPSSYSSDYGAGFEITHIAAGDQERLQRWLSGVGNLLR
jgi:hypothetical protein